MFFFRLVLVIISAADDREVISESFCVTDFGCKSGEHCVQSDNQDTCECRDSPPVRKSTHAVTEDCNSSIPPDATLLPDTYKNRLLAVFPDGTFHFVAGKGKTCAYEKEENTEQAKLIWPSDLAVDDYSNEYNDVYIADAIRSVISTISIHSGISRIIAGKKRKNGHHDGDGVLDARFNRPHGITVSSDGIYVADSENHVIRRIEKSIGDKYTVTTLAGKPRERGFHDGRALGEAQFSSPSGLDVTQNGDLFIADTKNQVVRRVRFNEKGQLHVSTVAGIPGKSGFRDGRARFEALFDTPQDVLVVEEGNTIKLYVADTGNDAIRVVTLNSDDQVNSVNTVAASKEPTRITNCTSSAWITRTQLKGPTKLYKRQSGDENQFAMYVFNDGRVQCYVRENIDECFDEIVLQESKSCRFEDDELETDSVHSSGYVLTKKYGKECVFPFAETKNGDQHNECQPYDGQLWCATKINSAGAYASKDDWGFCADSPDDIINSCKIKCKRDEAKEEAGSRKPCVDFFALCMGRCVTDTKLAPEDRDLKKKEKRDYLLKNKKTAQLTPFPKYSDCTLDPSDIDKFLNIVFDLESCPEQPDQGNQEAESKKDSSDDYGEDFKMLSQVSVATEETPKQTTTITTSPKLMTTITNSTSMKSATAKTTSTKTTTTKTTSLKKTIVTKRPPISEATEETPKRMTTITTSTPRTTTITTTTSTKTKTPTKRKPMKRSVSQNHWSGVGSMEIESVRGEVDSIKKQVGEVCGSLEERFEKVERRLKDIDESMMDFLDRLANMERRLSEPMTIKFSGSPQRSTIPGQSAFEGHGEADSG